MNECIAEVIGAGIENTLTKPSIVTTEDLFALYPVNDDNKPQKELLHNPWDVRSVFMSDFHIGTSHCNAKNLVRFLEHIKTEYLYLIGDIVDCWQMNGLDLLKIYAQGEDQMTVLYKLHKMLRHRVKIIYIPGNHDDYFRNNINENVPESNFAVLFEATHEAKDGRRILILHGDSFDEIVRNHNYSAKLGTHVFDVLVKASIKVDRWRVKTYANRIFSSLGIKNEWSLAQTLQDTTNKITYSKSYNHAALSYLYAKNAEIYSWNIANPTKPQIKFYDEIICGHTHIPFCMDFPTPLKKGKIRGPEKVILSNTGSWTGALSKCADNQPSQNIFRPECTAMIEYKDGSLSHVAWHPDHGIVPICADANGGFDSFDLSNLKRPKKSFAQQKIKVG